MPASSSLTAPVAGHLADLAEDAAGEPPGLLAVLGRVAGPRHRRGVRHRLAMILGLAACAVLAGARSFTAIAEWAAGADAETFHAVTSLTITQASHAQLAAIIRGHWGIEDRLHWVRDMDFDEDRSQARTAAGPRIMASLRNLVITILRLAGAASIAAALRYHARRPGRPLQTIMKC